MSFFKPVRLWTDDSRDLLFIGTTFGIPIMVLSAVLIWGFTELHRNEERWQAFKIEHACKPVARISGSVFNTLSVDGKGAVAIGIGSTPDKTGWLCDDGVTYYR